MKSLSIVVFAAALATLAGCAAETNSSDTAAASSNDDLTVSILKLSGAYSASEASSDGVAAFKGIVFNNDGHFFADLDTGADATARISGTFMVTGHSVTLSPPANAVDQFYGRYDVTIADDGGITLTKPGNDTVKTISSALKAQPSYCAAAVDCGDQNLIHPMCAPGGWTCSAASACAFKCGN